MELTLTPQNRSRFISWFEASIGTEFEIDEPELGHFEVTIFELTARERRLVEQWLAQSAH